MRPGVLTSDPRIVPSTRPVMELTFEEATELAYFGAQVLHPQAMQPAIRSGKMNVRVKNSYNRCAVKARRLLSMEGCGTGEGVRGGPGFSSNVNGCTLHPRFSPLCGDGGRRVQTRPAVGLGVQMQLPPRQGFYGNVQIAGCLAGSQANVRTDPHRHVHTRRDCADPMCNSSLHVVQLRLSTYPRNYVPSITRGL